MLWRLVPPTHKTKKTGNVQSTVHLDRAEVQWIIKPDLTAFGGDIDGYFHVIAEGSSPVITPQMGTSFSAPYALRSAVGIRSIMGQELSPLAIKALLVHAANTNGHHVTEVGWGKIPENLNDIITSPDGVARIVYQESLSPENISGLHYHYQMVR